MKAVYLSGCGLASSLGMNLPAAMRQLAHGGATPSRFPLPGQQTCPYFTLPEPPAADWYARAQRLILQTVAEAGPVDHQAPLFIASSSLDIGALEQAGTARHDCLSFVDTIANWLHWQGPTYWISTACTSSMNALLAAHALMEKGNCSSALVLGLELQNQFTPAGFAGMQLLAQTTAKPLGAHRDGLVLGEAIAAIVLTSQPGPWQLLGGANITDGNTPTSASPTAITRAIAIALAHADISASDIDLIKLQAAGSPSNDAIEIAALGECFASLPPLISLKSSIGHTLGAAGAAETALLVAMLNAGLCPPVPYPEDVTLPAQLAKQLPASCTHVLSLVSGFGGGHCALVLRHAGESA